MTILTVAFMLLFNYLDTLPKLYDNVFVFILTDQLLFCYSFRYRRNYAEEMLDFGTILIWRPSRRNTRSTVHTESLKFR